MTQTNDFQRGPVPTEPDIAPDTAAIGDFNPEYPGSTRDAPYGYFANGNPRKRAPRSNNDSRSDTEFGNRASASRASSASAAAGLLARMNGLLGLGLASFGMPLTARAMADANEQFEVMAREALLTDPALCKVILSGGVSSGKAGLIMAYGALGIAMLPAAQGEMREKRLARAVLNETEMGYVA